MKVTSCEPLRIAVTSFYLPSESKIGAGWAAHRLANALADLGHNVTMLSPCMRPEDARYSHVHLPIEGRLRTFRWPFVLRNVDLSRFDALLAQGDDHLIRRNAVPVHIRTLHGSCFDEARFVPDVWEKFRMLLLGITEMMSAIRVKIVVGVSWNSIRMYPWLSTVIPNGVDTDVFHPGAEGQRETAPTILFVGTFKNRKRGELVHRAFTEVILPTLPDAKLWMVCTDAPTAPGVEVLGRLSDEELADRYRRAWVFCLPSRYEGFGVPYAEALVCGLPVIATPNPGAEEVLEYGEAGLLTEPADLALNLLHVLQSSALREQMTSAGLARASRFDSRVVAQKYLTLIRDAQTALPSHQGQGAMTHRKVIE